MSLGIGAIIDLGSKLIDRIIPDKEAKAEAQYKLLELAQKGELAALAAETELAKGQLEINKAEAANGNLFVSGWRPAIGWLCGAIFGANYVVVPFLAWISPLLGIAPPPRLEIGEVLPVLLGMLGLGGLRTVEKVQSK